MNKSPAAVIAATLETIFAELDAEVLARSLVWIEERTAAVEAFRKEEDAKPRSERLDTWKRYERLFAIAGGKTWYEVMKSGPDGRAKFMTKNCAAVVAKRNAMISRKLDKAGVTSVISSDYARTSDGFDGFFSVETNTGRKAVKIQTIRAGGYNIQCLHLRVLVSVK